MENKTRKQMKTPVRILLLVVLALAVAASGFGIYFAVSGGFGGPAEPPVDLVQAEADFRAQMADSSVQEVTLPVDLVLTSPVEVVGNKVITGEGSLTAAQGLEGKYLFTVPDGVSLALNGDIQIDAAGISGGVYVAVKGSFTLDGNAVVANAAEGTANIMAEGNVQMKGGTLSGGWNNVVLNKGAELTWSAGTNSASIRSGIVVAEGAKLSMTAKAATLTGSGLHGIELMGSAVIEDGSLNQSYDTMIQVAETGTLEYKGGTLSEAGYHGIDNAGTLNVTGGIINKSFNSGVVNTGKLTVTGGTIMNSANKGIMNKLNGHATIGGDVLLSTNRFAVSNEDNAYMELSDADLMASTTTNVYAYGGEVYIHDIELGASASNNVRVVAATVTMKNVIVAGNTASGSSTTHGILLEGGKVNATDVTVRGTKGNGIRNKGGEFIGQNITVQNSGNHAVSNRNQDVTNRVGVVTIDNLIVESTRYNNLLVEGGITTITNSVLNQSGTNNIKISDGDLIMTNVKVMGNVEGAATNVHGIYMTGGKLQASDLYVEHTAGAAFRVNGENAVVDVKNVTTAQMGMYSVSVSVGQMRFENAVFGPSKSNNLRLDAGSMELVNVDIQGHYQDSADNVHGLYINGGVVNAKDLDITNPTGAGLRNNGGELNVDGVTISGVGTHNLYLTSEGKTVLTNAVLGKAKSNSIVLGNGVLNMKDVTVQGNVEGAAQNVHGVLSTGGKLIGENISFTGTAGSALRNKGAEVVLTNITVDRFYGYNAISNALNDDGVAYGNVTVTGLTVTNGMAGTKNLVVLANSCAGSMTITDAKIDAIAGEAVPQSNVNVNGGTVVLKNVEFGKTFSNNIRIDSGELTLEQVNVAGHVEGSASNVHGIYTPGGKLTAKDVTVNDTTGASLRNGGGDVTMEKVTFSGAATHTLNLSGDGKTVLTDAVLGASGSNNVMLAGGELVLKNTEIQGQMPGGKQNEHGILANGGKLNAENLIITGTSGSALRNKGAEVVLKDVTVDRFGGYNAISNAYNDDEKSYGNVSVENLTVSNGIADTRNLVVISNECPGSMTIVDAKLTPNTESAIAQSNVVVHDGAVSLHNVELGKTSSNNVRVNGGVLNMENITIPGHVDGSAGNVHGLYVPGGEVIAKDLTITGTTGAGLRNAGGKVTVDNFQVENVGSHTLYISGGETVLNNSVIGKTGTNNIAIHDGKVTLNGAKVLGHLDSAPGDAHAIFVYGGQLDMTDVTVSGTTGAALRVSGGSVNGKTFVAENIGSGALHISAGKTVIDGLTTTNVGGSNVSAWGDGVLEITNASLCPTKTHNVKVDGGTVLLHDSSINGHIEGSADNVHAVYVTGGSVDVRDVTIANPSGDGLRVDAVKDDAGNLISQGALTGSNVTISGAGRHGIWVSEGTLTLADSSISGLKTNKNNVLVSGGSVSLSNMVLDTVNENNNVSVNGGELKLHDMTIHGNDTTDGGCHNLYVNGSGKVTATGYLKLLDAAGAGIRMNDNAVVTAENVTISGAGNYGMRLSANSQLTIDGLEISGTKSNNVLLENGTVTLKNAVLGETNSNSIKIIGGYLTLESVEVLGHVEGAKSDVHGIFLEGTGVLDAKDILIANTAGQALRVKGSEATVDGLILRNIGGGSLMSVITYKDNPGKLSVNRLGLSSGCDNAKNAVNIESEGCEVKLSNSLLNLGKNMVGVNVTAGEAELDNVRISGGTYSVRNFGSVTLTDSTLTNSIWSLRNEEGAKATLIGGYYYGNKEGTLPSDIYNGGELTIRDVTVGYNRSGKGTSGVIYQAGSAAPIVLKGNELGVHTPSKPILLAAEEWVKTWGERVPIVICDSVEDAMDVVGSFKQGKTDPYLYISQRDNHLELTTQGADAIQPGGNYIIKIGSVRFESFEEAFEYIANNADFNVTGEYKKAATIQVIDSYDHFENVVIPEGFHITLVDDGDALRVIKNNTDGDMFTVGSKAMLTIRSTEGKTPVTGLCLDGAGKADAAAIHVNGGNVALETDLVISNAVHAIRLNGGVMQVYHDSILTVSNVSNGVYAVSGTVNNLNIVGTKGNGVYMDSNKADVTANNLTIEGFATGINATNGTMTVNGLYVDVTGNNIMTGTNNASVTSNAVLTINGYADGNVSMLLPSASNNIAAYYGSVVNLKDVLVMGHDEGLTSNIHGIIITGATVNLDKVTVENTVMAGIRLNAADSTLNAANSNIRNTGTLGISLGSGNVTLGDGVVIRNTGSHGIHGEGKSNLNITGAVTVDGAAANALHISGNTEISGALTLQNIGNNGLQIGGAANVTVTGEVRMGNVANRGIAVSGGTLNAESAKAVTLIDVAGVGLESTGHVSINNLTIDTNLADAVNAHNIKIIAGTLKLNGNTYLGQSNSQNFLINGSSLPVVDLTGTVTIKGTDSNNALKIDGGIVNLDGQLNIQSAAGYGLVIYGEQDSFTATENATVTVSNATTGICVSNGTVTMNGSVAVNHVKDRGVQVLKGAFHAENAASVTITDALGIGLESYASTAINNLTIDTSLDNAVHAHNIKVLAGTLTLNGNTYLGQSNSQNFLVNGGSKPVVELNGDITIKGTDSNNALKIDGGHVILNGSLNIESAAVNGIIIQGKDDTFTGTAGSVVHVSGTKGDSIVIKTGDMVADTVIVEGGYKAAIVNSDLVLTEKDANGETVETGRIFGNLTIEKLTIKNWAASGGTAIYHTSGGCTTINGGSINTEDITKDSHFFSNNVYSAKGFVHLDENGDPLENSCVVTLNGVTVGKTINNNVIASNGATLALNALTVQGHVAESSTSNIYGVLVQGGIAHLQDVTIEGITAQSEGSTTGAIRLNHADSVLTGSNITIQGVPSKGISMSAGLLDVENMSMNGVSDRGISLTGGKLNITGLTVDIVNGIAIEQQGSASESYLEDLKISSQLGNVTHAHAIKAGNGRMTVNGAEIGRSNSNNFRVEAAANVELMGNVSINGTDGNNALVIIGNATLAEGAELNISDAANCGIYYESGAGSFVAKAGSVVNISNCGGNAVYINRNTEAVPVAIFDTLNIDTVGADAIVNRGGSFTADAVTVAHGSKRAVTNVYNVVYQMNGNEYAVDENGKYIVLGTYAGDVTIENLVVENWNAAGQNVIYHSSSGTTTINGGYLNADVDAATDVLFYNTVEHVIQQDANKENLTDNGNVVLKDIVAGATTSNNIRTMGGTIHMYGDITIQGTTSGSTHGVYVNGGNVRLHGALHISDVFDSGIRLSSGEFLAVDAGALISISNAGNSGFALTGGVLTLDGTVLESSGITDTFIEFYDWASSTKAYISNVRIPKQADYDIEVDNTGYELHLTNVTGVDADGNVVACVIENLGKLYLAGEILAVIDNDTPIAVNVLDGLTDKTCITLNWTEDVPADGVAVKFVDADGNWNYDAFAACKDSSKIVLADSMYDLYYHKVENAQNSEDDLAVALPDPKYVTTETNLGIFLKLAKIKGIEDVIVPIAASFEVANRVALDDSFKSVTFQPYDNGDYTLTYTGESEGLFIIDDNDKLTIQKLNLTSTKNTVLYQNGGELVIDGCVLNGTVHNLAQMGGTTTIRDCTINETSGNNVMTYGSLILEGNNVINGTSGGTGTHGLFLRGGDAIINGTLQINGTNGDALQATNQVKATINGTVNINGGGRTGVVVAGGSELTVNGSLNIANTTGPAVDIGKWDGAGTLTVTNGGVVNIGKDADGNVIASDGVLVEGTGVLNMNEGGQLNISDVAGNGICVEKNASLTGHNITIERSGKLGISNRGKIEVTNLKISESAGDHSIMNDNVASATITINGAHIGKSKGRNFAIKNGTVNLNGEVVIDPAGGSRDAICFYGNATLNIYGELKIRNINSDGVEFNGKNATINIYGTMSVDAPTEHGINMNAGNLIVHDGGKLSITNTGKDGMYILGGKVTVNGTIEMDAIGGVGLHAIGGTVTSGENGTVTVKNTSGYGVYVGNLYDAENNVTTAGTADVTIANLNVENATAETVFVEAGSLTVSGKLTTRGNERGLRVNGGTVTVNSADIGAISKNTFNVWVQTGELTLRNAVVGKVGQSNNVNVNGGKLNLHNVEVLGNDMAGGDGKHLLYINGNGSVTSTGCLKLSNGSAAGIRMDGNATMTAESVTITGTDIYGIRNNANTYLEIAELITANTDSVTMNYGVYLDTKSTATIKIGNATLAKTSSNNLIAYSGKLILDGTVTVNGTSGSTGTHGIWVDGGDVEINGTVNFNDAKGAGIRIHSGSVTVASGATVNITGNHGIQPNGGTVTINGTLNATNLTGSGINMYTAGTINVNGTMTISGAAANGVTMTAGTLNVASGAKLTISNTTGNGIEQSGGTVNLNGSIEIDTTKTYVSGDKTVGGIGYHVTKGTVAGETSGSLIVKNTGAQAVFFEGDAVNAGIKDIVIEAAAGDALVNRNGAILNVGKLTASKLGRAALATSGTGGSVVIGELYVHDQTGDRKTGLWLTATGSATINGGMINVADDALGMTVNKNYGNTVYVNAGTVNLSGLVLGKSNSHNIAVEGGTVNLKDVQILGTASGTSYGINVTGSGVVNILSGTTMVTDSVYYGVVVDGENAKLNISGELKINWTGTPNGNNWALYARNAGTITSVAGSKVTIDKAKYGLVGHSSAQIQLAELVTSNVANSAIYGHNNGKTVNTVITIDKVDMKAGTGCNIEAISGNLTINGGSIAKTSGKNINVTGAAVVLNNVTVASQTGKNAAVTVTNGTLTINDSTIGGTQNSLATANDRGVNTILVSGGTLNLNRVTVGKIKYAHNLFIKGGDVNLTDVTIEGVETNSTYTYHAIWMEGSAKTVVAKNLTVKDCVFAAVRSKAGTFNGTDLTFENVRGSAIQVSDKGIVNIDGLTMDSKSNIAVQSWGGTMSLKNATLYNRGTNHMIELTGSAKLSLENVVIGNVVTKEGKYEVFFNASALNISGKIDGDFWLDKAAALNVTGTLTDGSDVTVDWAAGKVPADKYGVIFADQATMDASKAYIKLGSIQGEKYLLHFTAENDQYVGKLVDNIITSEYELNEYFAAATYYGITDPTILIGDSFAVTAQVAIPDNFNSLTITDDGDATTANVISYSGSTQGGLFLLDSGEVLTVRDIGINGNGKANLLVPADAVVNAENVTIEKAYNRGVQIFGALNVTGNLNVESVTAGNKYAITVEGTGKLMAADGSVITVDDSSFGLCVYQSGCVDIDKLQTGNGTIVNDAIYLDKNTTTDSNVLIGSVTIKCNGRALYANGKATVQVVGAVNPDGTPASEMTAGAAKTGLQVIGSAKVTVENVTISGQWGADLGANSVVTLKNVYLKSTNGNNVKVYNSANVTLTDVTIDGSGTATNQHGIYATNNAVVNAHGVLTIKNTSGAAVRMSHGTGEKVSVTIDNLITENCGTYALYTGGGSSYLTIKNGTLGNAGSHHVIYLNGGPMNLKDVTISNTPTVDGMYEIYSDAGNLYVSGKIDGDVVFGINRTLKVTGDLTDTVNVDWLEGKIPPNNIGIEFSSKAIMDASAKFIELGKIQSQNHLLHCLEESGKYVGKLASRIVTSEQQLKDYLAAATYNNISEATVLIGDSFAVTGQVAITDGITKLTITDDGDDATTNTITYNGSETSIFKWNACTSLTLDGITIDGNKKGNVNVEKNTVMTMKDVTVLKPDNRGIVNLGELKLGGNITIDNTDGNTSVWGVAGEAGSKLTSEPGTTVSILNVQYGFVANGGAKLTTETLNVTNTANNAIYLDGNGSDIKVTKAIIDTTTGKAVYSKAGTLTIDDLSVSNSGNNNIHVNGGTVIVAKAVLGDINKNVNNILVSSGSLTLKNASVGKIGANNNICINGGVVNLHNVEVLGNDMAGGDGKHLLYANGSSVINATGYLKLSDGSAAGIRMDGTAKMTAESVTISGTKLYGIRNTGSSYFETKSLTIGASATNAAPNTGIQSQNANTVIKVTVSATLSAAKWNVVGDNGTIEITGGVLNQTASNNVATTAAAITLTNCQVNGTGGKASDNIHAVFAKGGDIVLNNVTISGAATAGIRINNANSIVTATDVAISNCAYGATMSAGELTLSNVTISDTTGHGIVFSGGTLNMNGKMVADVYTEQAKAVNVTGSLTDGSAVTVDWAAGKVPTGNAIIFKDAQTLTASKTYITLGSIMTAEGYVLNYNETTATLVKE